MYQNPKSVGVLEPGMQAAIDILEAVARDCDSDARAAKDGEDYSGMKHYPRDAASMRNAAGVIRTRLNVMKQTREALQDSPNHP